MKYTSLAHRFACHVTVMWPFEKFDTWMCYDYFCKLSLDNYWHKIKVENQNSFKNQRYPILSENGESSKRKNITRETSGETKFLQFRVMANGPYFITVWHWKAPTGNTIRATTRNTIWWRERALELLPWITEKFSYSHVCYTFRPW